MLRQKYGKVSMVVGLWVFLLISGYGVLLYAQQDQVEQNDYEEMEKFLPSDNDADDDAKVLLMIQCTACHSAKATTDRIAQRIGGDITFWTTLARRMNTTWNAKIPDEDIDAIVAYLAKHFGPSAAAKNSAQESEKQPSGATTGKGNAVKGEMIFKANCVGCHDPNSNIAQVGPSLKGLFQKPSHRHADGSEHAHTEGEIRQVIEEGNNIMPPMKGRLSEEDLVDLLAYLQTL